MAGRVWTASESQWPDWNSVQQAAVIKGWEGPAIEEAQSIEEQDTWNVEVGLAINISWDPPLTDNSSKGKHWRSGLLLSKGKLLSMKVKKVHPVWLWQSSWQVTSSSAGCLSSRFVSPDMHSWDSSNKVHDALVVETKSAQLTTGNERLWWKICYIHLGTSENEKQVHHDWKSLSTGAATG